MNGNERDAAMTTDELLDSHLHLSQSKALRQFAAENGIEDKYVRLLARISGRGYRPPTDVAGWQQIYDVLRHFIATDHSNGDD